ncbi:MAG TPA: peptide chain release factor N(5)-glutamine methyltransferase [Kiritimatiellia bacterium]|nr:peptide chain release factor N(5)-glutamine methyltransferase [Kiritimatiellia bacterium]
MTPPPSYPTWREHARRRLASNDPDEVESILDWLVSERTRTSRLELHIHGPARWDPPTLARLHTDLDRLAAREPLAYVLGTAPFRSFTLAVSPAVLIPRPETEHLIDLVLADPALKNNPRPSILDIGTGSGCIALALAAARPEARVIATDLSPDALDLARANAASLRLDHRIQFLHASRCGPLPLESIDLIVSNPPYISENEWTRLDPCVRDFEPKLALAAGSDGLDLFRQILPEAYRVLRPSGVCWLEMGETQASAVTRIAREAGFPHITIHRDLYGKERFLRCSPFEPS